MMQSELHMSALRGKFHSVIDQIGDGLEQKIAVAMHRGLICRFDSQGDASVFGDWLVEIADLAYQRTERNLAKPF
jgi:hypothetical protein